jgi:hypothetical protein
MDNIEHLFFGITMVIFGLMGVVWNKYSATNLFLKIVFLAMSGWASWMLATALGYVVKV